ncbi:MAG: 8-oxo-dGTP diphosphatase [Acidobacteriota bacterium]
MTPPDRTRAARSVDAIDWWLWQPRDLATLTFVRRADDVLLMRKKRGLGAGKVNAPGGRLEPGESPRDCAVRETQEELGVTPRGVADHGRLSFQFVDGYSLHVYVFRADAHDGVAIETDEAVPLWTHVDRIPYDEMWSDDRLWLPHLLAGRRFAGRFIFEGDTMLDQRLELVDELRSDDAVWRRRMQRPASAETESG